MLKETTFKEKISLIERWLPDIIDTVKRDIKNDHLKNDRLFISKYLDSKNINKFSLEELVTAYRRGILEEEHEASENIGYFLANRWILKHSDIYDYFEKSLSEITEDFNEIDQLSEEQSDKIVKGSLELFGAPNTYVFSVLNSVVFPQKTYDHLKKLSDQATDSHQEQKEQQRHAGSIEEIHQKYQTEIARLKDKYEKKLQGFEKKYTLDTEALKKQISSLHKKLNG